MDSRVQNKLMKYGPRLFILAYVLYAAATYLQMSLFTEFGMLAKCFALTRYISFALVICKIGLDIYSDFKNKEQDNGHSAGRFWWIWLAVSAIALLLSFIVSMVVKERSLLFVAAFLLGVRNVKIKGLFQTAFRLQCTLMVIVMLAASAGIIQDLLVKRLDIPTRHSLGFTYPSVALSAFGFALSLYLWNKTMPMNTKELLVIELINYLFYILTDSRTGFILFAALPLGVYCLENNRIKALYRQMSGTFFSVLTRIMKNVYDYLALYLSILVLLCAFLWPQSFAQFIDQIVNQRVRLLAQAIKTYGIHLFGSKIEWIGFGGSLDPDSLLASYNFVDCSYGYILVNYGLIIFAIVLAGLVFASKFLREKETKSRCLIFAAILLYSVIEPRLIEIQLNVFLFLIVPSAFYWIEHIREKKSLLN